MLVFYETQEPEKYSQMELPEPIVVHRYVRRFEGHGLIVCGASFGKQGVSTHPQSFPTQTFIDRVIENGYDSVWFRQDGIESLLLLKSHFLVPLYGCVIE
jgi:hypothetical protein